MMVFLFKEIQNKQGKHTKKRINLCSVKQISLCVLNWSFVDPKLFSRPINSDSIKNFKLLFYLRKIHIKWYFYQMWNFLNFWIKILSYSNFYLDRKSIKVLRFLWRKHVEQNKYLIFPYITKNHTSFLVKRFFITKF